MSGPRVWGPRQTRENEREPADDVVGGYLFKISHVLFWGPGPAEEAANPGSRGPCPAGPRDPGLIPSVIYGGEDSG